jgi:hypothetical protein
MSAATGRLVDGTLETEAVYSDGRSMCATLRYPGFIA